MKATIVDLRYHMKDVLRAIDRGETVTVFYRGKEKAKLMPVAAVSDASNKSAAKTKDQPFFGMWSDREDLADPSAYLHNLRQPRQLLGQPGMKTRSNAKSPK